MTHRLDASLLPDSRREYERDLKGRRKRKCAVCGSNLHRPRKFTTCSRCDVKKPEVTHVRRQD